MCETKVVEKIKTHFMFINFFLNGAIDEIMWKNIVEPRRPQVTVWAMGVACFITKATHTHTHTQCNTAVSL